MGRYLEQIDAAAPAARWPLVRRLMEREPAPFFRELHAERPVLVLPELTFLSRYADCTLVLHRFRDFGVDLYKPKQGDYFMAQDDTADHWRDKAVMRAVLDFEDLPAMRAFVAERSAAILREAGGTIDAPQRLTRAVPVALVQKFFGFDGGRADKLIEWSYWNQQDAFHNQAFDADVVDDAEEIVRNRKAASIALGVHIGRIVAKRAIQVKLGGDGEDPVSRLLRLSFSDGLRFPITKVLFNVGGLLIGSVETTSHTANNALAELFRRPEALEHARAAAGRDDPAEFDGYVFEALRFNPAFSYFFRTCHRPTVVAGGTAFATEIQPGTTVLACTKGAMLDEAAYPTPERFDHRRTAWDTFVFGYGEHECLGRAVAAAMLPEIVRQCLRLPGLHAEGPIGFRRGVPERHVLRWAA